MVDITNSWETFKFFNENSIEKLIFFIFSRKFVSKNNAFGNNTRFLQKIFRFGGGRRWGFPPFLLGSPLAVTYTVLFKKQLEKLPPTGYRRNPKKDWQCHVWLLFCHVLLPIFYFYRAYSNHSLFYRPVMGVSGLWG